MIIVFAILLLSLGPPLINIYGVVLTVLIFWLIVVFIVVVSVIIIVVVFGRRDDGRECRVRSLFPAQ